MICLMLLLLINCQSTNYYEVAGVKNELFTKRQGSYINAISNYRIDDRINYSNQENEQEEVSELENMNELITVIGSAIAGVYCAVKAIINAIKSLKAKRN